MDVTAKLFMNGKSQAVRLPKEFRFEGSEVGVRQVGEMVVLFPLNRKWDIFTQSIANFSDDFMSERDGSEAPVSSQ